MSEATKMQNTAGETAPAWYLAARRTAAVAAGFCALVFVLLLANVVRSKVADPVQPVRIEMMVAQLNKNPGDQKLRARIRRLDRELRLGYFRGRAFSETGMMLLLGGVVVYLLAMEAVRRYEEKQPAPDASSIERVWVQAAMGRRSVLAMGICMGGLLATLAVASRHDASAEYARAVERPQQAVQNGEGAQAAPVAGAPAPALAGPAGPAPAPALAGPAGPAVPVTGPGATPAGPVGPVGPVGPAPIGGGTLQVLPVGSAPGGPKPNANVKPTMQIAMSLPSPEWAANWPAFRGPGGAGVATVKDAPTKWDGVSGSGIAWKVAVPLPGWNSPVVWGDRIFMTGADKTKREVYCFSTKNGALLWQREVANPAQKGDLNVSEDAGYAPATMVADGKRAYAIFVNGDIVAIDFAGKTAWTRRLGTPENSYGHASSLRMWRDRLIVQYDQGSSPNDGKSALLALNSANGQTVWEVKRPVPNSWSTPLIIRAGKSDQIITCANPLVISYDAASGKELWRASVLGGEVAPSPTYAGGFVIAANLGAGMSAIAPDGTGDVTKTKVAWTQLEGLPDITSPAGTSSIVLVAASEGAVTCFDAKKGAKLWTHIYEAGFRASPTVVGGRAYLLDQKGFMHVLEAGKAFKEVATAPLGEEAHASPAFAGGRIYIRGAKNLYCIGAKG